jgi:uncharacterized protein (DUF58 family)
MSFEDIDRDWGDVRAVLIVREVNFLVNDAGSSVGLIVPSAWFRFTPSSSQEHSQQTLAKLEHISGSSDSSSSRQSAPGSFSRGFARIRPAGAACMTAGKDLCNWP